CPRPAPPNRFRHAAVYLFRAAQVGLSLCHPGHARLGRPPPAWSTAESDLCTRPTPQSARRSRPSAAWRPLFAVELSGARDCPGPAGGGPGGTGWAHAAGGKGRLNFLYSDICIFIKITVPAWT